MKKQTLDKEQIKAILKEIFESVAPEIDFNKINLNESLRNQIEIDSYDFYKVLVEIHEKTGVNIPDSVVRNLKNLDEMISFIEKQSVRPQGVAQI